MQTVIYARYSSNLQDARSIDDQVRLCRERAQREGWPVVDVFMDYAISGAAGFGEAQRPGLNALLARVAAGGVDQVLSEALDRIARHQADSATIFETLKFNGARIFTLADGEVSELHIGMKGTMDALFRKDLAAKIRRGQSGRVAAGRIPGGLCYGYRKVIRLDAKGNPELGLREVDPEQAEIVRRIFREFNAGLSAVAIARRLNDEGIPSPTDRAWRVSMINGDKVRGNGILHNEIYIGQLVYGRTQMVRDPVTRKRVPKVQPRDRWQRQSVPELRIVDQAQWDSAHAQRAATEGWSYTKKRRPARMLSGLCRCGECGGSFIVIGDDRWGCGEQRSSGRCSMGRSITTVQLERRVLEGLKSRLLDPELVRIYVKEYHEQHARQRAQAANEADRTRRKLRDAQGKIERLVDAISRGADVEEVVVALQAAKADRQRHEAMLAEIDSLPVIALHPNIADDYRARIEKLDEALTGGDAARLEAVPAIRGLIESVTLIPREDARGLDIELTGRLASIIALASGKPVQSVDCMFPVVAEEGLEPPTRGL